MLTARSHRLRTPRAAFIIGIVAGLSVLVGAVFLLRPGKESAPSLSRAPSFTYDQVLQQPLDDGRQLPLKEARSLIPFEIPLPHHELASPDNLVESWISPQNHVALRFSSDVLIIFQVPDFDNATVEFTQLVASGSAQNAHLDLVQNETALVMEPDTDLDGENPGSLQFVRNGVSITVYGRDTSGETLKEVASTIQ